MGDFLKESNNESKKWVFLKLLKPVKQYYNLLLH